MAISLTAEVKRKVSAEWGTLVSGGGKREVLAIAVASAENFPSPFDGMEVEDEPKISSKAVENGGAVGG